MNGQPRTTLFIVALLADVQVPAALGADRELLFEVGDFDGGLFVWRPGWILSLHDGSS
jgi:hypothetical protein